MLQSGLCFVYNSFLVLLLSFLFSSRPPDKQGEEWHRYLSFDELRDLRKREDEVAALSSRLRVGDSPLALCVARRSLVDRERELRRVVTRRVADSVESAQGDHTQLWKVVRNFRLDPDASEGMPIDALCEHFTSLFNRVGDSISVRFAYAFAPHGAFLDSRFTMGELESVLRELDRGSAPGPSGVGNDVILHLVEVVGCKRFLLNLYNGCFEGGSIPAAWNHCEMFILYKGKGDPLLPASYRAIALLEAFVKLYERLLCHRLQIWASQKDIIPPAQFGFRRASSTLDAAFVFWKLVSYFVSVKRGLLFAALIDFKSAFPSVDRSLLFNRLPGLGMSKKFGCALHSLFEGNTFQLRLGDGVTEAFPVTTGLKEGSVLSPLLFSIFIADLEKEVLGPLSHINFLHSDCMFEGVCVNGLLFADDLVIFARTQRGLQHRLRLLKEYADRKKLTVNTSKCEIVAFGAPLSSQFSFRYGTELVPVVRQCKYLGIYFHQVSLLGAHAEHLVTGFQNAVGAFFRLGRELRLADLSTWKMLQTSLLFSVLYGVELLDNFDISDKLATHYRKALRSFIGLPNRVSNNVLDLLFPDFTFLVFFLKRKHAFLRRMASPCNTLAPVFFLEDRVASFPASRGFSAALHCQLEKIGLGELIWSIEKDLAEFALTSKQHQISDLKWAALAGAKATHFLAVVFGERSLWHEFLTYAGGRTRACLRICLVTWTGSIEVSSARQARRGCPFCSKVLDTRHFFICEQGTAYQLELVAMARERKWPRLLRTTLDVYFRFLFRFRPSVLTDDEEFLTRWDEETEVA